jgi:hypothetical protein
MKLNKSKIKLFIPQGVTWLENGITGDERMLRFALGTKTEQVQENGFYKSNFQPSSQRPLFRISANSICSISKFIEDLTASMETNGLNQEYLNNHIWKVTSIKNNPHSNSYFGNEEFSVLISVRFDQNSYIVIDCFQLSSNDTSQLELLKNIIGPFLHEKLYKII